MTLLDVENLHVYYGQIHALKGITLHVDPGEIVTLIGANGAGKSTTLKTISGLLRPREGRITLSGQDLAALPAHEVVASGGGLVRSRVWAQMIADALGRALTLGGESEASSRGAALLALDALGLPPGLAAAPMGGGELIVPDPLRRDRYRQALARQRRLYDTLVVEPP